MSWVINYQNSLNIEKKKCKTKNNKTFVINFRTTCVDWVRVTNINQADLKGEVAHEYWVLIEKPLRERYRSQHVKCNLRDCTDECVCEFSGVIHIAKIYITYNNYTQLYNMKILIFVGSIIMLEVFIFIKNISKRCLYNWFI